MSLERPYALHVSTSCNTCTYMLIVSNVFVTQTHTYLAQYLCGILPLEIETGRWQNKPVEERICKVCESGEVENEFH